MNTILILLDSLNPTGGINISNLSEYVDKPYIHAVGGS